MGKIALPAGTQWAGLNKRVDPVEITPEQSPDCANVFFYDQTLGLLGPRLGKAYAGATNYNIWGVIPYNISGQIGSLVAYGDSTSTEINLLNLYSVTTPHAGWGDISLSAPDPAIPATIVRGFYVSATPIVGSFLSPQEDPIICSVDVNGALWAIATAASTTVSAYPISSCRIDTYLKFDADDYVLACRTILSSATVNVSITETPTPVNCTGKLLLTGIKCIVTSPGNKVTVSGDVRVMGVGKAVTEV